MASYSLQIKKSAARELEAIDRKSDRERVVARILALATDPRPPGCEKLAGGETEFRVRQGDFRIVYQVFDKKLVVLVVRVRNRKEVYR